MGALLGGALYILSQTIHEPQLLLFRLQGGCFGQIREDGVDLGDQAAYVA